jgi:hypothetical protein
MSKLYRLEYEFVDDGAYSKFIRKEFDNFESCNKEFERLSKMPSFYPNIQIIKYEIVKQIKED